MSWVFIFRFSGEPLTIAYCSPLKRTQDRRVTLAQNKLFLCRCDRCMDPTELGSGLSTLKCPKCKADSVLPESFEAEEPKWECRSCQNFSTSDKNVQMLLAALNKDTADEPVKNLEKWLANVRQQRLGANHALVMGL